MEGFLIGGSDCIFPGRRWLHEPYPINDQPIWSGFLHRVGRCRPGGSRFSSPIGRSCRDMEGFLTRGWETILSVFGGNPMALWLEEYSCSAPTFQERVNRVWQGFLRLLRFSVAELCPSYCLNLRKTKCHQRVYQCFYAGSR